MTAYSDAEPAIDDDRLDAIADLVRRENFPWLEGADFASARILNSLDVWEVHFLVIVDDPRPIQKRFGQKIASRGRTLARDWDESERERRHFAGKPDPAYAFYRALGRSIAGQVRNASEQITDSDKDLLREMDALKHSPLLN